jgi:hypothetical protein
MNFIFALAAVVLWGMALIFGVMLLNVAEYKRSVWKRLAQHQTEREAKFARINQTIERHEQHIRSLQHRPSYVNGEMVSPDWSTSSSTGNMTGKR